MKLKILALVSMSTLIVGCDWGSSNSRPTGTDIDTDTETYTLTAIDGYLSDAEIYIDRNKDGIADDDELTGTTDSNGEIELDIEAADYPVIVRAIAGTTKDSDYSETVSTTYEMIADAGSVVVTPYTSLAYLYDMSIEELVEELDSEDSFSFDRSTLSGDYSALSSDAAIIAQALARSVASVFGEFIADNYDSGSDNTTLLKSYLATMIDMFKTEIANGTEISSLSDSVIDFEKDSNGNVVSMVISSISDSESDTETGSDLSASRYAINDTGITECIGASAGQDCDYGRDENPFMNSDDNGHAGFNFVKLSSAGAELSADATSWDCVQDNITGLVWEVKTDDGYYYTKNPRFS